MEDTPKVAARRRRLAEWIEANYEPGRQQAAFVEATGIAQSEVSQLLKDKSFAEKKAESIEKAAGMPPGYLVDPLRKLERPKDGSVDADIYDLKGDVQFLRAVLNAALIALSKSTPDVAGALRKALAATPGNQHGYAREAFDLVCETQSELIEKELSDLHAAKQRVAKKTAKQASR